MKGREGATTIVPQEICNLELWTILGHCTRRSKIKIQKDIKYGRYIKLKNYSLKILKMAMIAVSDLSNYITGTTFLIYGYTGIRD